MIQMYQCQKAPQVKNVSPPPVNTHTGSRRAPHTDCIMNSIRSIWIRQDTCFTPSTLRKVSRLLFQTDVYFLTQLNHSTVKYIHKCKYVRIFKTPTRLYFSLTPCRVLIRKTGCCKNIKSTKREASESCDSLLGYDTPPSASMIKIK